MNIVNLYENYNKYFSAEKKAIFEIFSKIASKNNFKIYLIGGIVRDLLLGIENLDIDITVEGNAIDFANFLVKECGAKIVSIHEDFGTIKVEISGQKIDLASTRSEIYPKKGHLPCVEKIGCTLEFDVIRRDFTINSLALSLNEDNFAGLIDYVGGFEDLKSKKIRVLHDMSFVDDPTRIIRGLKYSLRLGFEIEEHTFELQRDYLENINYDMCYARVKNELKLTLGLNFQKGFEKFINQKIYKLISQKEIEVPKINIEDLINKYKPQNLWLVYLGVIGVQENDDFSDKLELTKVEKNIILGAKSLFGADVSDDFEIYKAFGTQKIESLLILSVFRDKEKVFRYLDFLREIKLSVNGKDLLEMGIAPSKTYTDAFDYVLKIKLKNPHMAKKEEKKLLSEYMSAIDL